MQRAVCKIETIVRDISIGETRVRVFFFSSAAVVQHRQARMEKMGQMRPMWIDVTWGAGGSPD